MRTDLIFSRIRLSDAPRWGCEAKVNAGARLQEIFAYERMMVLMPGVWDRIGIFYGSMGIRPHESCMNSLPFSNSGRFIV